MNGPNEVLEMTALDRLLDTYSLIRWGGSRSPFETRVCPVYIVKLQKCATY